MYDDGTKTCDEMCEDNGSTCKWPATMPASESDFNGPVFNLQQCYEKVSDQVQVVKTIHLVVELQNRGIGDH